jgi:hypothetical protein
VSFKSVVNPRQGQHSVYMYVSPHLCKRSFHFFLYDDFLHYLATCVLDGCCFGYHLIVMNGSDCAGIKGTRKRPLYRFDFHCSSSEHHYLLYRPSVAVLPPVRVGLINVFIVDVVTLLLLRDRTRLGVLFRTEIFGSSRIRSSRFG